MVDVSLGAFMHALLSRVTLASAGLSCNAMVIEQDLCHSDISQMLTWTDPNELGFIQVQPQSVQADLTGSWNLTNPALVASYDILSGNDRAYSTQLPVPASSPGRRFVESRNERRNVCVN